MLAPNIRFFRGCYQTFRDIFKTNLPRHPIGHSIGFRNWEKDASRKDAKDAKFLKNRKIIFFAALASWRDNLY